MGISIPTHTSKGQWPIKDFRCFETRSTIVENRVQISNFFASCKHYGGREQCVSAIFSSNLSNLCCNFCRGRLNARAALEENICKEGQDKKLTTFFSRRPQKHRPKLPNQLLQPSKKRSLCNCLVVLLYCITAAVSKDLWTRLRFGGQLRPAPAPT